MICPLCQRPCDRLMPDDGLLQLGAGHGKRLNPNWTPEDGCCQSCFNTIQQELERKVGARLKNIEYRQYHRHVLSESERERWNADDPELREQYRESVSDLACREAMDRGVDCYLIIDGVTEQIIAQGAANPFVDE